VKQLEAFPGVLRNALALFKGAQIRRRSSTGLFAPVEQAWHLADLEVEGYGARIEQLLLTDGRHFVDFDGGAIAEQRRYLDLDLESGLRRFENARATNVARLSFATSQQLEHRATQDGVEGYVTLSRIIEMMTQHDASHANEIVQLLNEAGCAIANELLDVSRLDDPLRRTA
jgi:hypothetical protein